MKSLAAIMLTGLLTGCGNSAPPQAPASSTTTTTSSSAADVPAAPSTPSTMASGAPATPPTPDQTSAPATTVAVTVAAFKYTPATGARVIEVKDDGSVTVKGEPGGKVTATGVQDQGGNAQLAVATDGTVTVPIVPKFKPVIKFSDKNELTVDGTTEVSIDDDGTVHLAKGKSGGKIQGFTPSARRAAELLIFRERASLPVGPKK